MGDIDEDLKKTGKKAEEGVDKALDKTKEIGGDIAEKTHTDGVVEKGKAVGDKFFTKVEDVAGKPLDKIQDGGGSIADSIEEIGDKGADALKKDIKKA